MYCTQCGTLNSNDANFCNACGSPFSHSINVTIAQKPTLKKTSVFLLIFLTFITFGIYEPIWFLTRKKELNSLNSIKKLNTASFVTALVFIIIGAFVSLLSGGAAGSGDAQTANGLEIFSKFLYLPAAIILIIQTFKVKNILKEHFRSDQNREMAQVTEGRTEEEIRKAVRIAENERVKIKAEYFSGAALFFFRIFYLQYKINQLQEE